MSKYELKNFADVLTIVNGKNQRKVENKNGHYPIYGSGGVMGYADDFICEENTVIIGRKGSINNPIFVKEKFWNVDTAFGLCAKNNILLPKYLYYFCKKYNFEKLNTTVTIPSLTKANLLKVKIPLRPLEEQKRIADILDKASNLIDLRKQQLEKMDLLIKSKFIDMFGDPVTNPKGWEIEKLGKHISVIGGYAFKSNGFSAHGIPVLRIGNINSGFFKSSNLVFWNEDKMLTRYLLKPGDMVISLTGTVGKDDYGNVCILSNDYSQYYLNQRNAKLEIRNTIEKQYLSNILKIPKIKNKLTDISRGVRQANISNTDILNLCIPVPPIKLQNQFAEFVEQVEKQKSVMQQSLKKMETNYKALMQEYFG